MGQGLWLAFVVQSQTAFTLKNIYQGDLVYLKMFGISLLFVNSHELARELFDKRGHIYSDRAHSVALNELYVNFHVLSGDCSISFLESDLIGPLL